jgi:hypothetical protein
MTDSKDLQVQLDIANQRIERLEKIILSLTVPSTEYVGTDRGTTGANNAFAYSTQKREISQFAKVEFPLEQEFFIEGVIGIKHPRGKITLVVKSNDPKTWKNKYFELTFQSNKYCVTPSFSKTEAEQKMQKFKEVINAIINSKCVCDTCKSCESGMEYEPVSVTIKVSPVRFKRIVPVQPLLSYDSDHVESDSSQSDDDN